MSPFGDGTPNYWSSTIGGFGAHKPFEKNRDWPGRGPFPPFTLNLADAPLDR
jgi:hypothetical protein